MQRLSALAPEWIQRDGRIVGVRFACPGCSVWGAQLEGAHQVGVLFLNPPDGGMAEPADSPIDANGGNRRWSRTGSTFDDLSLSPSIHVRPGTESCWHGHVLGGVVT